MSLGMTDHLLHNIGWGIRRCCRGTNLRLGVMVCARLSSELMGHGAQLFDRQGIAVEGT